MVFEKSLHALRLARAQWPLHGFESVVADGVEFGEAGQIEHPRRAILRPAAQPGMFDEDFMCRGIAEGFGVAHAFGDLADRPPVRSRFPGHRQERALTGDATLGVGDGTVLLAPGRGRQQEIGEVAGVGIARCSSLPQSSASPTSTAPSSRFLSAETTSFL